MIILNVLSAIRPYHKKNKENWSVTFLVSIRINMKNIPISLLHQQSLCAKHITVEDVMTIVVKIVNYIRAQPLYPYEFRLLFDEYNMGMVMFCCILRFDGYPGGRGVCIKTIQRVFGSDIHFSV